MDLFLARQPIFDRNRDVIAYELLFRSTDGGPVPDSQYEKAALDVIRDIFFVFGLDSLTGGKKAFINLSRRALVEEKVTIFPPDSVVVEILENIEPDEEVVRACAKLKASGYTLALDDFEYRPAMDPLIEMADYIKVDFRQTQGEQRRELVDRFTRSNIKLLAEKVETHEEFHEALECGYLFFQGYFICRPELVSRKDIPGFKANYLRIMREVNRPEVDIDKMEQIIKHDLSLSYKLLRYLNSAWFGWRTEVKSIKAALVKLGEKPTRKWASMVAYTNLAEDKPSEILLTSLVRARFCELMGPDAGLKGRDLDLFLVGMFSLIDSLVDRPLGELLDELEVSQDVKSALQHAGTPMGRLYDLVLTYERGDWERVIEFSKQLNLDEARIPDRYTEAVKWAEQVRKT